MAGDKKRIYPYQDAFAVPHEAYLVPSCHTEDGDGRLLTLETVDGTIFRTTTTARTPADRAF